VHLPEVQQFLADTTASNMGSRRVLEKCRFSHYKTEVVEWEKQAEPAELTFYQADRTMLAGLVS
jgi:rRNA maturation protein Rpf1